MITAASTRTSHGRTVSVIAALAILTTPIQAWCAPNVGDSAAFDTQGFHPAITSSPYLTLDSAFVPRHLSLQFGLFANYTHDAVALHAGSLSDVVVGNQIGMDLTASIALFNHLEIGVLLPFTAHQTNDNSILRLQNGLAAASLGDLQLDVKLRLLDAKLEHGHFGIAVIAGITAPTSTAAFAGQDNVTGRSRLAFEYAAKRFSISTNIGAVMRQSHTLYNLYIGSQFTYGLAARVRIFHGLAVLAESYGRVSILLPPSQPLSKSDVPLEILGGLSYRTKIGLEISAAAGGGIVHGYSVPDARAIIGLRYRRKSPMRAAAAITAPQYVAPPPIVHTTPIIIDQDSDGDGIVDRLDKCPNEKGTAQYAGCPQPDRDHDGIPDAIDRCPDQPGVSENEGCPDEDTDGDGFIDRLDACPFDPEIFNNVRDNDGCPEAQPPALVQADGDEIVLWQPILFLPTNEIDPKSFPVINALATLIKVNTEWKQIRIDAHTDGKGNAATNLDRSRLWAAAVRRRLIDNYGINESRLIAQGFGSEIPLKSTRARARTRGQTINRRVELHVISRH